MIIDILNYELNINSLGMVRSPNGEIELGVDDFLKLIDSRIDQYVVRKDPLSNHFDIKYAASVHKNKKEYVIEVKDYDGIYHLNLGSNPKLAKKFDKFCEITEKNEAQIENYDKLYLEKDDEKIDYPSAVDYIKKHVNLMGNIWLS